MPAIPSRTGRTRPASPFLPRATRPPAWLALLTLPLFVLQAGCGDEEGGTPTPSDSTPDTSPEPTVPPTSPTPRPTPTPTPEPTPIPYDGNPARAFVIDDTSQLLSGAATLGRVGDIKLTNDFLQAVIQAPGRDIGWGMFGGTLIDAAVVLPDGSVGEDSFGELSVLFNVSSSMNASTVTIQDDGAESGVAVVVAEGEDDLFDIMQLNAAVEPYGVTLPYDLNADFPLRIRTTYTLRAGASHIDIETTFFNDGTSDIQTPVGDLMDSGGDVEAYIPNPEAMNISLSLGGESYTYSWGGFGEAEYSIPDWLAFFGPGVAYGWLPPRTDDGELNAIAVSVAGVSVTVTGTDSILDVFAGTRRSLLNIPAGGDASFSRKFFVGRDISSISDAIYHDREQTTGLLSGSVVEEGTGKPLPGVRVSVLKNSDTSRPVTACYTDAEGHFTAQLPAGNYGLIAMQGFDFTEDSRPSLLTPQAFSVKSGSTTEQTITLGVPASLHLSAFEGSDGVTPVPVRVVLEGAYQQPPSALIDVTRDKLRSGTARIVWLEQGSGTFDVKPGTYTVTVSRGFEYDVWRQEGVVLEAGKTTSLEALLTRVLDTTGYLSADLHVHGINSPDSAVPLADRVRTFVTEGVEVLVSTDHDVISNYQPTIDALGVDENITTLNGVESTTFNMGHFNVFPLEQDPQSRSGGALDWADSDNLPIDPATGSMLEVGAPEGQPSSRDNLTPSQLVRGYDRIHPGTQVRQINHARGDLGGDFTMIGLDLSQYGQAGETSADPADFRLPEDADLFDPTAFSALEIQNGLSVKKVSELLNDWFALLNLGVVLAGTGVSDTHDEVGSTAGYARTFVAMPVDSVAERDTLEDFGEAFAASVNGLHTSSGAGIFVTTQAVSGAEVAGMGELLQAPGGALELNVRIQAPTWSGFDTVEVFVNTPVQAVVGVTDAYQTPADVGPAYTLQADTGFPVETVAVDTLNPSGASRLEANLTLPLELTEDAWIVVVVRGQEGQLSATLYSDATPLAFSNPIFVDADGSGQFDPPGPEAVLPPSDASRQASEKKTARIPQPPHACQDGHNHQADWDIPMAVYFAEKRGTRWQVAR